ncbi:sensor domain-containing diguanylate cyclase [Pseudoalteromonas sp. YIC-656]|uniref:sensor domain-containing diguanylate cyclase n=1 Tax=Pseudoalteromonas pernae TaxID=3118054 RepID=UPI0032427EFC
MQIAKLFPCNLRQVILAFGLLSVVVTLANQFVINYHVQSKREVAQTLSNNEAYARKIADISSMAMNTLRAQLAFSAKELSTNFDDPKLRNAEATRLLQQNDFFNSVVIVNKDALILDALPKALGVAGISLRSEAAKQSLNAKMPIVPQPFISPSGNLILSPSHPIVDAHDGLYLGYVAGTIYLHGDNVLARVLGTHFHGEKVSISVVSANGVVIFDTDERDVGSQLDNTNALWPAFTRSQLHSSGALTPHKSHEQLMAFATVPELGWVVIVSSDSQKVVSTVGETIYELIYHALPVTVLTLLGIWFLASKISAPLQLLASRVSNNDNEFRDIPLWYHEIRTLKRAFEGYRNEQVKRIDALSLATHTDPLTGIGNRRYMQTYLEKMCTQAQPFAVITLDIDFFKRINDTYGHDVGDKVIKSLAALLKKGCREYDGVFRSGGEEFMLLLPGIGLHRAFDLAERLREQIAEHQFLPVPRVTVSIGVSVWQEHKDVNEVLKEADNALYRAKEQGRNQTQMVVS